MYKTHIEWLAHILLLVSAVKGAIPAQPVTHLQLAAQLYPDHTLLQLSPKTTSRMQAAIGQASTGSPAAAAAAAIIVMLSHGAGSTLVVDKALTVEAGQSLVLTTPAALEAAAEGDAAAALKPADLLVVQCHASKTGDFIYASNFSSLELLGLSVQGCTAPAITAEDGDKLKLFNTQLLGNKAEDGGALLITNVQQVELKRFTCISNYATASGGCLNAYRGREIVATDSVFRANWKSGEATCGLFEGGAAMYVQLLARLTVTRCEFSHNAALCGNGGAIFCSNCEGMTITASKFTNNSALDTGGAVFAGEVGLVTITDTNFTDNGPLPKAAGHPAAANGGAVGLQGTRTGDKYPLNLVVRGCKFTDNEADVGGAIYGAQYNAGKGRMEIHDSIFTGNKGVTEGGGVFMEENMYSEVVVNSSVFEGNVGGLGGAVDVYDSDVLVTDCTFISNEATDADGGAIQAYSNLGVGSGNKLTVMRSTFTQNYASSGGGAVLVEGQDVDIRDVVFATNEATFGGAVSVANVPTLAVTNSVFENNTSVGRGGGLRVNNAGVTTLQEVRITGNKGLDGGGIYMVLVSEASFTNLSLTSNKARAAGGSVAIIGPSNVTWTTGKVSGNMAPLGAGMAADSSTLHMEGVEFTSNVAQDLPVEEEEGSTVLELLKQEGSAEGVFRQFADQSYLHPTGGAVLIQQSALHISSCNLSSNTASGDGGALFMQQPTGLSLTDMNFNENVAENGAGLMVVGSGPKVPAVLRNCSLGGNRASGGGGAAVLDSGMGPLDVTCEGCVFEGNIAGKDGGAVSAIGPTNFTCTDCKSQDNAAVHNGGWISCSGCSQASILSGSSSNNSAGALGGAVSCTSCGFFNTTGHIYIGNTAGAGGAVAVQAAAEVGMRGCTFDSNKADSNRSVAASTASSSAQQKRMSELPRTWQAFYNFAAPTAGADCTVGGAGGGLCVDAAANISIADSSLTNNSGSTGGAMFASASCGDKDTSCLVQVQSIRAAGNMASKAGGVLYTRTPQEIQLSADSSGAIDTLQQQQLIKQLEQDNKVAVGGYGAALASLPYALSIMAPSNEMALMSAAASAEQQVQQPRQQGRRRLQQLGDLNAARDEITDTLKHAFRTTASASSGIAVQLDPVCPLLGASVLDNQAVEVDSNQIFSLPIYMLDAFGASVRAGPGSNWVAALQGKATGNIGQLSGASRARLQNGHVVLSGLKLQAEPGSNVALELTAIPPPGASEQPLSTDLRVQVRSCLAGQEAVISNSSSTGASINMLCSTCAAPTFSFSAYQTGRSAKVCNTCPSKGHCVAGMLIPRQGAFQVHPRSAQIRNCPNTKACLRSMDAMQNLQGLQCAYRRYNNPAAIDHRPYTALQCGTGYAGPLCSSCYRPGRNAWLVLQLQQSAQRNTAGSGYTFGDEVVLVKPHANFDESKVYGKSNGRCTSCPHIAMAWIGFILARGLDMLFIAALALLWLCFGRLSQSAAAALGNLNKQHPHQYRLRDNLFTSNDLLTAISSSSSSRFMPQLQEGANDSQARLGVANNAELLQAVMQMACLAQVMLDGAQIVAVLLSLDLLFFLPDWVATALSAVVMTQATTWQWVAFDCLLPGDSSASAAVVQTVLALMMPLLYVAVLYPVLLSILDMKAGKPSTSCMTVLQSTGMTGPSSKQGPSNWRMWNKFWPTYRGTWPLLTAIAVASMAYSYAFYVANVMAAFNCMTLGRAPSVPGEVSIRGSVWVPDMQLTCGSKPHLAVMLLAVLVGFPLLVGYWLLLLTLSWPADVSAADMAGPPVTKTGRWSLLARLGYALKAALLLPVRLVEPCVRFFQRHTSRAGLSGECCAGLGVWHIEQSWWWLFSREGVKMVIVMVATVTCMRGPDLQGRVLLLAIVLAAGVSWRVQAGCSKSMDKLQYVMWCFLQLLALLVLVPSLPGVSPTGYGVFLLTLLALVLLLVVVLLGCLVHRFLQTCRLLGSSAADIRAGDTSAAAGQRGTSDTAGMPVTAVT